MITLLQTMRNKDLDHGKLGVRVLAYRCESMTPEWDDNGLILSYARLSDYRKRSIE